MKGFDLLKKYCRIEKQYVYAKKDCVIHIDEKDFKSLEEDMIDVSDDQNSENNVSDSEELSSSIVMPGSFDITFDDNIVIEIYLSFDINLIVHEQSKNKGIKSYYYKKGDLIFCAFTKTNTTNIMKLTSLFNNSIKYLSGKIDKQLLEIHNQMVSTNNVMMHHLEVLLSQVYVVNTEDGPMPLRMTGQEYSKDAARSIKESAHLLLSDSQSFNFGYTKDMITNSLAGNTYNGRSDMDDIIIGKFKQ